MNANKKLLEASMTIRNLTIERDALKAELSSARKALAEEARKVAVLTRELHRISGGKRERLARLNAAGGEPVKYVEEQ